MPSSAHAQTLHGGNKSHALADMYQRLPGNALAAINPLRPSNFAALEVPFVAPKDVVAHHGSNRGDVFSQWKTYTLPHEATLSDALAAIEQANCNTRRARKFQLNFTNGAHMVLSRDDPADPTSLVFSTVYNPNSVFRSKTAASVQSARRENQNYVKPIAGPNGHLLHRRPQSGSSFSPNKIFHHAPSPSRGHDGFAFTPMSGLSHQLKPNAIIPGVRPGLRETSPNATYFRPRPVSAANLIKSTLSPERGASVNTSIYPDEEVDNRYRKIPSPPRSLKRQQQQQRPATGGPTSPAAAARVNANVAAAAAAGGNGNNNAAAGDNNSEHPSPYSQGQVRYQ